MNARDVNGRTPLYIAVEEGHREIVEILIWEGADVNGEDKEGRTPLHIAVWKGDLGLVQTLVDFGADVNARDVNGRTPLHIAVEEGHREIMEMLIREGADVNCRDSLEATPFIYAVYHHYNELEDLLRQVGADTSAWRIPVWKIPHVIEKSGSEFDPVLEYIMSQIGHFTLEPPYIRDLKDVTRLIRRFHLDSINWYTEEHKEITREFITGYDYREDSTIIYGMKLKFISETPKIREVYFTYRYLIPDKDYSKSLKMFFKNVNNLNLNFKEYNVIVIDTINWRLLTLYIEDSLYRIERFLFTDDTSPSYFGNRKPYIFGIFAPYFQNVAIIKIYQVINDWLEMSAYSSPGKP